MSSFGGHAALMSPTGIAGAIPLPAKLVEVLLPWDDSSLRRDGPARSRRIT